MCCSTNSSLAPGAPRNPNEKDQMGVVCILGQVAYCHSAWMKPIASPSQHDNEQRTQSKLSHALELKVTGSLYCLPKQQSLIRWMGLPRQNSRTHEHPTHAADSRLPQYLTIFSRKHPAQAADSRRQQLHLLGTSWRAKQKRHTTVHAPFLCPAGARQGCA